MPGASVGSAAMVRRVSAAARKRIPYTTALLWAAITAISSGTVNTTWKYSASSNSAVRRSIHAARASD
jgi:hypothetical protein